MIKNNVTRMLDAKKITYTAHQLPSEKIGALEAANYLGIEPKFVYKTIVAIRSSNNKPILGLVSALDELDLKATAKGINEKKVVLASHSEAEKITGLQTGGISPLALTNKGFEVLIDTSAEIKERIFISGGERGMNIEISPTDLRKLTNAKFLQICKNHS